MTTTTNTKETKINQHNKHSRHNTRQLCEHPATRQTLPHHTTPPHQYLTLLTLATRTTMCRRQHHTDTHKPYRHTPRQDKTQPKTHLNESRPSRYIPTHKDITGKSLYLANSSHSYAQRTPTHPHASPPPPPAHTHKQNQQHNRHQAYVCTPESLIMCTK